MMTLHWESTNTFWAISWKTKLSWFSVGRTYPQESVFLCGYFTQTWLPTAAKPGQIGINKSCYVKWCHYNQNKPSNNHQVPQTFLEPAYHPLTYLSSGLAGLEDLQKLEHNSVPKKSLPQKHKKKHKKQVPEGRTIKKQLSWTPPFLTVEAVKFQGEHRSTVEKEREEHTNHHQQTKSSQLLQTKPKSMTHSWTDCNKIVKT